MGRLIEGPSSKNKTHTLILEVLTMRILLSVGAIVASATALPSLRPLLLTSRADTSSCPYTLPANNYEFPHLIIPINNSDVALGNSYNPSVTPNNCATIFNFDIPSSRANQHCSLYFTFPRHDQLETSDFKWDGAHSGTEGPGSLSFVQYKYNTGATTSTTGNSQPPLGSDPAADVYNVQPGNSYKVWDGSCGAGGVMSWKMSSEDSSLYYFQDWNPCAIGVWVVYEAPAPMVGAACSNCPGP